MSAGCIYNWVIIVSGISVAFATPAGLANSEESGFCKPIVIAHRGASGFIPEHTLAAYSLAIEMDADFIEPDIVITKDKHLIALHQNELGLTTNIADHPKFNDRKTTKIINNNSIHGWFAEDFTLEEIKELRVIEAKPDIRPCNARMNNIFEIPTLEEIINLVKSFRHITKRIIGICPEIKYSTYFKNLNLPIEKRLVDMFHKNGYRGKKAPVYIQSGEINSLKELRNITDLKLLLLYDYFSVQPDDQEALGNNITYGDLATLDGLKYVATFAHAVGPDKTAIIADSGFGNSIPTDFVKMAHTAGLELIPYTFRLENTTLNNFTEQLNKYFATGIDGIFTDYPNIPLSVRGKCSKRKLHNVSSRIYSDLKLISTVLIIVFYRMFKLF